MNNELKQEEMKVLGEMMETVDKCANENKIEYIFAAAKNSDVLVKQSATIAHEILKKASDVLNTIIK